MSENKACCGNNIPGKIREAICIDTNRVYDSCADKDCLADLRVYFPDEAQNVINNCVNVKLRSAHIINCLIDVEKVPFNKGCYTVDITFFFKVAIELTRQAALRRLQYTVLRRSRRNAYSTAATVPLRSILRNTPQMRTTTSLFPQTQIHVQRYRLPSLSPLTQSSAARATAAAPLAIPT